MIKSRPEQQATVLRVFSSCGQKRASHGLNAITFRQLRFLTNYDCTRGFLQGLHPKWKTLFLCRSRHLRSHAPKACTRRIEIITAGCPRPSAICGGSRQRARGWSQLLWSSGVLSGQADASVPGAVLQTVRTLLSKYPRLLLPAQLDSPTVLQTPYLADPLPAPPEPAIQQHLWGHLGSLRGPYDLENDLARRNGGSALPFSKEEDRFDHFNCIVHCYLCHALDPQIWLAFKVAAAAAAKHIYLQTTVSSIPRKCTICPATARLLQTASWWLSSLLFLCRLLLDARNLGKTFADIAKMLPARNITTLRKHYSMLTKPKVSACTVHADNAGPDCSLDCSLQSTREASQC